MQGILVGCDITQEWLLPWWWSHYQRHNSFPVAFVDLGLSFEMKDWCQAHGQWIRLQMSDHFVAAREEMDTSLVLAMENECGKAFWPSRGAWFKKPFACLQSPFQTTLWIDLDCEIRGNLDPLFSLGHDRIALAKDGSSSKTYNAGVIGFTKGLPLIERWATACFKNSAHFRGDQDVLNALLQEQNIPVTELPSIFNWSRCLSENKEAVIVHWHGPQGKACIAHKISSSHLKSDLFSALNATIDTHSLDIISN